MDTLIWYCLTCKGRYPIGSLDLKSRRFGCDFDIDGPSELMHSPKMMKKRRKFRTKKRGKFRSNIYRAKRREAYKDKDGLVC